MRASQQHPDTWTPSQALTERIPDALAGRQAEERADIEEDQRRQQELDEGEMGGES